MKKQRIGIIMLFTAFTFNLAVSGGEINRCMRETPEIVLQGDLDTGGLRSGGDAITAEVWGDAIAVALHKNVGNLLVTTTNEAHGTIHEATANTPVQQQLFIPLAGLPSGTYTIAFSNGRGEMWGEFEI